MGVFPQNAYKGSAWCHIVAVGALMVSAATGQAVAEPTVLGIEPIPKTLNLESEYQLSLREIGSKTFSVVPLKAKIASDESGARFGFQYSGYSGDGPVEERVASLSLTVDFDMPSGDLEIIAEYVSRRFDGSVTPTALAIRPSFFYMREDTEIEVVPINVPMTGTKHVTLPAGAKIPIALDLAFLGDGTDLFQILSGVRPAGIFIDAMYAYQYGVIETREPVDISKLSEYANFFEVGQDIESFIEKRVEELDLKDPVVPNEIISGLRQTLPEPKLRLTDQGEVKFGWTQKEVEEAVAQIKFPEAKTSIGQPARARLGIVLLFSDLCEAYEENIVDLDTFEHGCGGLSK